MIAQVASVYYDVNVKQPYLYDKDNKLNYYSILRPNP